MLLRHKEFQALPSVNAALISMILSCSSTRVVLGQYNMVNVFPLGYVPVRRIIRIKNSEDRWAT